MIVSGELQLPQVGDRVRAKSSKGKWIYGHIDRVKKNGEDKLVAILTSGNTVVEELSKWEPAPLDVLRLTTNDKWFLRDLNVSWK